MFKRRISWIKILIALLLVAGLPLFIWAVATQRIELRKRAATAEPTEICWNRVIYFNNTYNWPNSCKGNPRIDLVCTQVLIPLTTTEIAGYKQWVGSGSLPIPGCGTSPTATPISSPTPPLIAECYPCSTNASCQTGLICQYVPTPTPNCPSGPNGPCSMPANYPYQACVKPDGSSKCPPTPPVPTPACVMPPACAYANPPCTYAVQGVTYCPRTTPTPLPPGCRYQQVQCFRAPCPSIMVCPTGVQPTPAPLAVSIGNLPIGISPSALYVMPVITIRKADGSAATNADGFTVDVQEYGPTRSLIGTYSAGFDTPYGGWTIHLPISQLGQYRVHAIVHCPYPSCGQYSGINISTDTYFQVETSPPTPTPPPPTPTPTCTHRQESIHVEPTSQQGYPGQPRTYDISIANNDSPNCPASTYTLAGLPTSTAWQIAFSSSSLSLGPGNASSVSAIITSPSNAAEGTYMEAFTGATNGSSWGTISVQYIVKNQSQPLTFKVRLAGVAGAQANGSTIKAKFYLQDGTVLPLSAPLTLTHVGNGVYQATATLVNPFPAGTPLKVQIKGEKHLALIFCKESGQTAPCAVNEYMKPASYVFDFTGIPLPPGDLNQDGKVDNADVKILTDLFAKPSTQLTAADLKTADVDYSGSINGFDLNLILQTLETRYDEQ